MHSAQKWANGCPMRTYFAMSWTTTKCLIIIIIVHNRSQFLAISSPFESFICFRWFLPAKRTLWFWYFVTFLLRIDYILPFRFSVLRLCPHVKLDNKQTFQLAFIRSLIRIARCIVIISSSKPERCQHNRKVPAPKFSSEIHLVKRIPWTRKQHKIHWNKSICLQPRN